MTVYTNLSELNILQKEYKGNLPEYQQEGNKLNNKKVVEYEQTRLSVYQNLLYKRAIHGLRMYSEKEIKSMHKEKLKRIKKVHYKTQIVLNTMKQERVNNFTNKFFEIWFPNSPITEYFINNEDFVDSNFFNTLDLKDLGINKSDIIDRLIAERILPYNFNVLTND